MPSSDVWGAFAQRQLVKMPLGWLDTEWVLRDRVFPLVFGKDPGGWWTADAMAALGIPTGGRWLDLGCGGGGAEIVMAQNGLFSRMVAYDPSPGAIDVARRQAAEAGISTIEFYQADVNTIELPEASFDVVHVNMALHHVRELEYVLYQANRALKPDGLFIANEFVGPSQFQFSTERMAEVTRCLNGLPERLRWNPIANEMKTAQPVYPRSWWNRWDPTEAVRSDEIPALIDLNFTEPRRIDYGGNLLNLVFENIAQNFDPTDPADRELIAGLFRAEDANLEHEPSDFAYFVARRGSPERLEASASLASLARGRSSRLTHLAVDGFDFDALRQSARIPLENQSGSARRLLGPSIARAKALVRRGLRFHLSPVVDHQSRFNSDTLDVVQQLVTAVSSLERENAELRASLARTQVSVSYGVSSRPQPSGSDS